MSLLRNLGVRIVVAVLSAIAIFSGDPNQLLLGLVGAVLVVVYSVAELRKKT